MQRNRLPIIGLIIFGVLALGLTALALLGGNKGTTPAPAPVENASVAPAPAPTPSTKTVVAQTDIAPRTMITREMLTTMDTPNAPAGAFTSLDQVVGRLASSPISANSPISSDNVTLPIQRKVPADFEVPQGLRAVAIYVDPAQTAAGLVDKGDHVDVIATYKMTIDKQDTDYYTQVYTGSKAYTLSRTVAQNLLVIGVDPSLLAPPPTPVATPGQAALGAVTPPAATPTPTPGAPSKIRVLLAATPAIAERLVAANDAGTLHLTVRGANSSEQLAIGEAREYPTNLYNVRKKQTVSSGGAPVNVSSPPRSEPMMPSPVAPVTIPKEGPSNPLPSGSQVTVIRGTDKTNVNVPLSP